MIINNYLLNSLSLIDFSEIKINLIDLLDFIKLLGSLLLIFIISYGIYKLITIYMSGLKEGIKTVLDFGAKAATIAGGTALVVQTIRGSGGSGSANNNNDNNNNNDDDKNKDKNKDTNKGKNKTNNPTNENKAQSSTPSVNIFIIKLMFDKNINKCFLFNNYFYNCLLQFKKIKLFFYNKIVNNIKYKQSSLLLLVLNYLNITIPENAAPLIEFSFGIFLISITCLFSYVNIIFYLVSLILIKNYDIELKFKNYPFLVKIIKYYTNTTILFAFIEGIICLICLIILIVMSLAILGVNIKIF